ncbi:MAG: YfcE family phosphodiesterase [Brevinematia bacterium]
MKRILVLSDSHGRKYLIREAIEKNKDNIDMIFHLGDFSQDMMDIAPSQNIDTFVIKGNMDPFIPKNDGFAYEEMKIDVEGIKIWAIHGHQYEAHFSNEKLYKKATEEKINLVLYGHTHKSEFLKKGEVYIFNPGALKERSYGIIKIDKNEVEAEILSLS